MPRTSEAERGKLAAMLVAYFPARIPIETAKAWLISVEDRDAADIAQGIKAMAENVEFPTLKAFRDAVTAAVHARCKRESDETAARQIQAWSRETHVDRSANLARLGDVIEAMKRRASKEEIAAIVAGRKPGGES